ncbi:hypothetical protein TWF730_000284 [Orbilia blumenaviensis]|uniref:Uncharacterized protein n=1 Tax=Orbilia blumenaviensis TaxID=1796055 RepID=A0AAV9VP94_9PEZI
MKGNGAKNMILDVISESIENEGIFDHIGDIIMKDLRDVERHTISAIENCRLQVIERLEKKLGFITVDRLDFPSDSDDNLNSKNELIRNIVTTTAPAIEKMMKSIGSLSGKSIAELRDVLTA